MVERDEVWAALRSVIHPTFGLSLVTLKMVTAVQIDEEAVTVELVMDCPGCPSGEAVLAEVNDRLRALAPGPGRVTVTLAPERWSPPWEGYWFTSAMDSTEPIDRNNEKDTRSQ